MRAALSAKKNKKVQSLCRDQPLSLSILHSCILSILCNFESKQIQMATIQKITLNLWFDTQAEDAAKFYTSIFKNSRIGNISRYGKEGFEVHGMPEGTVMVVEFELDGQKFLGLNGG